MRDDVVEFRFEDGPPQRYVMARWALDRTNCPVVITALVIRGTPA